MNNVKRLFERIERELNQLIEIFENEAETILKNEKIELKTLLNTIRRLDHLKEEFSNIGDEWKDVFRSSKALNDVRKKTFSKLRRGLSLPENEYIIPILESVVELGGRAKTRDVLKKVREKVAHKLTEYDFEGLPSNPNVQRWKNKAMWCRQNLVNEGLLSSFSERGIWEITDKGLEYLRRHKNAQA